MRLVSLVASTSQQAMAELRAKLGDDAVIVTSRTLENGDVRITGAIAEKEVDLADVLTPAGPTFGADFLARLADFHEWPDRVRAHVASVAEDLEGEDPQTTLITAMRSSCHFGGLITTSDRPVLLSGPPGSGKTATIAKLAALRVLADQSVDVLTTDTERAGALSQLRTLLEPLGLIPKVLDKGADARTVLADCTSDMVLIDCPGTNPYSSRDLGALSMLVDQMDAEILLILEAGRSPADSGDIGQSYAALGAKRMIVTKVDLSRRLGGLMAVAESGLALCGAGIGPTIGDGLRPLTADGLARLLFCRYESASARGGGF